MFAARFTDDVGVRLRIDSHAAVCRDDCGYSIRPNNCLIPRVKMDEKESALIEASTGNIDNWIQSKLGEGAP